MFSGLKQSLTNGDALFIVMLLFLFVLRLSFIIVVFYVVYHILSFLIVNVGIITLLWCLGGFVLFLLAVFVILLFFVK